MNKVLRSPAERRLLAFDCAAAACSVAVWSDGRVVAGAFRPMARGQVEALVPMVADAMQEAGFGFADLDGLAVTVGPGSFTGVRVGLAAARGFALAAGLQVVAVTTFEAIAAAVAVDAPADRTLAVAIDAKRGGDLYFQLFRPDGSPFGAPGVAPPGVIAASLPPGPMLVAGDGQDGLVEAAGARACGHPARHPDARAFVPMAVARLSTVPSGGSPSPLYLRAPDVTLSAGGDRGPMNAPAP